jgi:hypothetical protein
MSSQEDSRLSASEHDTESESDEGEVYVVLTSLDTKGRPIEAPFVFDCRASFEAHDRTDFDSLIGLFHLYVEEHADSEDDKVGPDDGLHVERIVDSIDKLFDPIYVNAATRS